MRNYKEIQCHEKTIPNVCSCERMFMRTGVRANRCSVNQLSSKSLSEATFCHDF